jgi:hypothetical protein
VADVIDRLDVGNGDFSAVFADLKQGLQAPLGGMGTAFSSSLFGLGGSLVLGFLDLQAGHAQNRFFNGLEEWLSGVTQLVDDAEQPPLATAAEPTIEEALPVEAETTTATETETASLAALIAEIRAERRLLERLLERQTGGSPAPDETPRG